MVDIIGIKARCLSESDTLLMQQYREMQLTILVLSVVVVVVTASPNHHHRHGGDESQNATRWYEKMTDEHKDAMIERIQSCKNQTGATDGK